MKKNMFTDNQSGKSSKGFYTAIIISAVMIGSACFYAYKQNEKLPEDGNNIVAENSIPDSPVDRKSDNIPKVTTPAVTTAPRVTTTVVTTAVMPVTTHIATIPAAAIVTGIPPAETAEKPAQPSQEGLKNVSAPLADINTVIASFSGNELVKNNTTGSWQTHNGTDYAAAVGDTVFAVSDGEITAVNDDPLWGITVTIDHHNGYVTKYCGLADNLSVQAGDTVVSGDTIGAVGDTADIESADDSHLHIEITHNGKYINAEDILK